jgi:hypothetical protein
MIRLAPFLLLIPLTGCAVGSLDCSAGPGQCKAGFQRFMTDTSVTLTTPDGGSFAYSSNPSAAATAEAFAAINRLAGLVAARPPAPLVSEPEPEDGEADGAQFTTPRAKPPLIDGVAHALDL